VRERENRVCVCGREPELVYYFHWTCRFAYICLAQQRRKIALVLISFARRRFILNPTHRTKNGENPTIFEHCTSHSPLSVIRSPSPASQRLDYTSRTRERNRHIVNNTVPAIVARTRRTLTTS